MRVTFDRGVYTDCVRECTYGLPMIKRCTFGIEENIGNFAQGFEAFSPSVRLVWVR